MMHPLARWEGSNVAELHEVVDHSGDVLERYRNKIIAERAAAPFGYLVRTVTLKDYANAVR